MLLHQSESGPWDTAIRCDVEDLQLQTARDPRVECGYDIDFSSKGMRS